MSKALDKAKQELDALRISLEAFIAAGPPPKVARPYKDGRAYVHIVLPTAARKPAKRTASASAADTASASATAIAAQLEAATASAIAAAERLEAAAARLEAAAQLQSSPNPEPVPQPQAEPTVEAPAETKPRGFRANYRAAYRAETERRATR